MSGGVDLQQAYNVACRRLGEAQVRLDMLMERVEELEAENAEAGARIVELTTTDQSSGCCG